MKNYLKEYLENRKKYIIIINNIRIKSNYLEKLPHINFSYKFNDLILNIKSKKNSIDLNYNIYTEEIIFESFSIEIDKNSIFYKKIQKMLNPIAEKLAERDEFLSSIYKFKNKTKTGLDDCDICF